MLKNTAREFALFGCQFARIGADIALFILQARSFADANKTKYLIDNRERIRAEGFVFDNQNLFPREKRKDFLELRRVETARDVGVPARILCKTDFLVALEGIDKFQRLLIFLTVGLRKETMIFICEL